MSIHTSIRAGQGPLIDLNGWRRWARAPASGCATPPSWTRTASRSR